jgi:hypothetical protein
MNNDNWLEQMLAEEQPRRERLPAVKALLCEALIREAELTRKVRPPRLDGIEIAHAPWDATSSVSPQRTVHSLRPVGVISALANLPCSVAL